MGDKRRWPRQEALPVAEVLRDLLAPACERIEIAGSLRREKPDVGDVELLAIPKPAGDAFYTDALDEAVKGLFGAGVLTLRPDVRGRTTYGPKNKLLVHFQTGIPVDVFATDARNWGMALVIRTGSAEFNVGVMQRFQALGMRGHAYGGVTGRNGQEEDCPTEERVFALLGWDWIEPRDRVWPPK